jgi:D-3-phosphoglycerate dehydrogenase
MTARPRVVFTDATIHRCARELLEPGCDVEVLSSYPSEDALTNACVEADAILARLGTVTARVIDAAKRLRIVARHGVGVDAVDVAAATRRGIVVTTTGSENAAAVAEYTFALMLALLRKVAQADRGMREGRWERDPLVGFELDGATLGVVGYGAIGRRVARQAHGFGMRVLACDPNVRSVEQAWVSLASLDELLARSDVVTLHVRLADETRRLLDARRIALMKPTAFLVNTSRGEVVDEAALHAALASHAIAGAALDTYEHEPLAAASPLRALDSVVLSPHVAGQTEAAVQRVARTAAQSIVDELAGRRPRHVWNPEAYEARQQRLRAGG